MTDNNIPPLLGEDEAQSMTLSDIYNQLLANNEIILTIPAEEEDRLRKGLAGVKTKSNKKLADEGFPVDNNILSYTTMQSKDDSGTARPGVIDIQICLAPRNGITVFDMKLPDNQI